MTKNYKIAMFGNLGISYGQICDENHIRDAFKDIGCTVYENPSLDLLPTVDLILTFKSNRVGPNTIKEWKTKTTVPVFIWSFDNMDRFSWFYDVAKECDLWLGEELGRRERFLAKGIPFYYFPNHVVNSKYFHKIEMGEQFKEYDVLFTGTPYADDKNSKFEILRAVQEKFSLHVYGNNPNGWRNQGMKNVYGPAFDDKLSEVISKSKIVLSISNTRLEGYWSIRASQVLLCGGFCLQRYSPQMEKESKDCVVYWSEKDDLLEKIDTYLKSPELRKEVADKGYDYAKKWLTNEQRCRELLIVFENFKLNKELFVPKI